MNYCLYSKIIIQANDNDHIVYLLAIFMRGDIFSEVALDIVGLWHS